MMSIFDNPSLVGLTNWNWLNSLGTLDIHNNNSLTSLEGLNNLSLLTSSFQLYGNDSLVSTDGLNSLREIRGHFQIYNNPNLTNLNGLSSLQAIDGNFYIFGNNLLTSLSGLDNIQANTIVDLNIYDNSSLTNCEVRSICEYLASPNGTVNIYNNATGCQTREEVEAACAMGLLENGIPDYCSVFPNPARFIFHFAFLTSQCQWVILKIYNMHGREVETLVDEILPAGKHEAILNAEHLSPGIYYFRISTIDNRRSTIGKVVILN